MLPEKNTKTRKTIKSSPCFDITLPLYTLFYIHSNQRGNQLNCLCKELSNINECKKKTNKKKNNNIKNS